jgi:cytochrome c553
MAHIVSKMSAFFTNCALCHGSTSLNKRLSLCPKLTTLAILAEIIWFCK